jgi:hypothetical protein
MFAITRTYGVSDVEELSELVREEFLPVVQTVPGFVAYYVVDHEDGTASSVTICEDRTGIAESTSRAAAWVEERVSDLITTGPVLVTGTVTAEATSLGIAA